MSFIINLAVGHVSAHVLLCVCTGWHGGAYLYAVTAGRSSPATLMSPTHRQLTPTASYAHLHQFQGSLPSPNRRAAALARAASEANTAVMQLHGLGDGVGVQTSHQHTLQQLQQLLPSNAAPSCIDLKPPQLSMLGLLASLGVEHIVRATVDKSLFQPEWSGRVPVNVRQSRSVQSATRTLRLDIFSITSAALEAQRRRGEACIAFARTVFGDDCFDNECVPVCV